MDENSAAFETRWRNMLRARGVPGVPNGDPAADFMRVWPTTLEMSQSPLKPPRARTRGLTGEMSGNLASSCLPQLSASLVGASALSAILAKVPNFPG